MSNSPTTSRSTTAIPQATGCPSTASEPNTVSPRIAPSRARCRSAAERAAAASMSRLLETGVGGEETRQRHDRERAGHGELAGMQGAMEHLRRVDGLVASTRQQFIKGIVLGDCRHPENGPLPLPRVEILAIAHLRERWLRGRVKRSHRVGALREATGEAEHPAVQHHLVQGRPRVERSLFHSPG